MELTLEAQTQAFYIFLRFGCDSCGNIYRYWYNKNNISSKQKIVVCYGYTIYACVYIYNIFLFSIDDLGKFALLCCFW